jgi:hypothetical protein
MAQVLVIKDLITAQGLKWQPVIYVDNSRNKKKYKKKIKN